MYNVFLTTCMKANIPVKTNNATNIQYDDALLWEIRTTSVLSRLSTSHVTSRVHCKLARANMFTEFLNVCAPSTVPSFAIDVITFPLLPIKIFIWIISFAL